MITPCGQRSSRSSQSEWVSRRSEQAEIGSDDNGGGYRNASRRTGFQWMTSDGLRSGDKLLPMAHKKVDGLTLGDE